MSFFARPSTWVVFCGALFCSFAAFAATLPLQDPDVWWVAAAGRLTLATGHVPTENLFSFTEPEHAWVMHEWALGPPYAAGLSRYGPAFFGAVTLGALVVHLTLILAAILSRTRSLVVGLAIAFICIAFFNSRLLTPRPSSIALMFPALAVIVAFGETFSTRHVALCVALGVVWANAHGSFILGPVMVFVSALHYPEQRRLRLVAALLMLLITVVNPYGLRLHGLVWSYLSGSSEIHREIHSQILEFKTIVSAFGTVIHTTDVIGWGLAVALALLALRDRRYRFVALFCLAMLASGARNVRHLQLGGLLTAWLLCPWVDEHARRSSLFPASSAQMRKLAGIFVMAPALVLGVVLLGNNLVHRQSRGWVHEGKDFFDVWTGVSPNANVYVPFGWAGPAIWYGYPSGIRVFFDPRNDCYSAQTFRDYRRLAAAQGTRGSIERTLRKYGVDTLVIPADHPLVSVVRDVPGFRQIGTSAAWLQFTRKGAVGSD